MFFHQIAGITAAVLALIALVPYVISILQKKTRPNCATWLIWTVIDFLIVASYWSSGARSTIWVPASFTWGALFTLVLSFKYGKQRWTKLDVGCLTGAGLSVIFWVAFRSAEVALLLQLLIVVIGSLPTLVKTWRDPRSENPFSWAIWFLACTVNILAIEHWTLIIAIYPIVCFLFNGLLMLIILWPRKNKKNPD